MTSDEGLHPLDPAYKLARLEKQLETFERLHGDELRQLKQQIDTYQRLHEDEVGMMRQQIIDLRQELEELAARGPVEVAGQEDNPRGISRRQFLTGFRTPPPNDTATDRA